MLAAFGPPAYRKKLRKTREIIPSMKSLPERRPGFTDKDLHDDEGNPVL